MRSGWRSGGEGPGSDGPVSPQLVGKKSAGGWKRVPTSGKVARPDGVSAGQAYFAGLLGDRCGYSPPFWT